MVAEDVHGYESLTRALNDISLSFFNEKNKSQYEDYIGYESLCNALSSLKIHPESEILNIAAGPGLIAAKLQLMGYEHIDGLDMDSSVNKRLAGTGLYRHNIFSQVGRLNSTGLREGAYDVVLMAGGFSPNKIQPSGLNELLRVTRVDGHILFTIREDYHLLQSDYALLESNILSSERSGHCRVIALGRKIVDDHSGLKGRLYILTKKYSTEDFAPSLPKLTPNNLANAVRDENFAEKNKMAHEEGEIKLCNAFFTLNLNRNETTILDLSSHEPCSNSSHSSCIGFNLSSSGYRNVDVLDKSLPFLNGCRKQDIYRDFILGKLGNIGSLPVRDDFYDVVIMYDGFAPKKALPSSIPEILRILRSGGYFLFMIRDEYRHSDPKLSLLDKQINSLVSDKQCSVFVGPIKFEHFDGSSDGSFYVLRKSGHEVFALGSPRLSPTSSPRSKRKNQYAIH
eukprot:TRINITY_DN780_c0_g1_i1.p1 TRINITY_DN780_c0_g1~~TRINITY_DN780_c0_g1_i1.p1  ORF type:complete len:454 (-),score=117.02 TRINITY_DN780_c0_g1_i1:268-1629(-)